MAEENPGQAQINQTQKHRANELPKQFPFPDEMKTGDRILRVSEQGHRGPVLRS